MQESKLNFGILGREIRICSGTYKIDDKKVWKKA